MNEKLAGEVAQLKQEAELLPHKVEKLESKTQGSEKRYTDLAEEEEGVIKVSREEAKRWEEKWNQANNFCYEIEKWVTKEWEEEFEKQLALKLKEKEGKLKAAMEGKRKKQQQAKRKGQVEKKVIKEKEDEVMRDIPITPPKKVKKVDEAPVTYRPRKTPVGQSHPTKNRKTTEATGSGYASMTAFIIQGVPCHRPIDDSLQELRKAV